LLKVAKALLDKEVLTSEELDAVIKGKKLVKSKKTPPASKPDKEKSKKEHKKIQPIKKPDLVKA